MARIALIMIWLLVGAFALALLGSVIVVAFNLLDGIRVIRNRNRCQLRRGRVEPEIIARPEPGAEQHLM